MSLLFDPTDLTTGCCGAKIIGAGSKLYCSFCNSNVARDMHCVNQFLITGDKMWLIVGHATLPVADPDQPIATIKTHLSVTEWMKRRDARRELLKKNRKIKKT